MIEVPPEGPIPARIMLVGEAPGREEEYAKRPFVGDSGRELDKMLLEAGISRRDCFVTNVCKVRPPGNDISWWISERKTPPESTWKMEKGKWIASPLQKGLERLQIEIDAVKPEIIIALGNTALWATTGLWGITSWRGSILEGHYGSIIPTYHPAAILRQWDWRWVAVHDLKRARRLAGQPLKKTPKAYTVRPSFEALLETLNSLLEALFAKELRLAVDIETRAGHIACIGLAWSDRESICIPLMCTEKPEGYWNLEEEIFIVRLLGKILTHPNARICGQNFIYDSQYIARWWGFIPNLKFDTMSAHHLCFLGLPKALYFIASLYNSHYVYWKDDGKLWEPSMPEDRLWAYNCDDAVNTFEAAQNIETLIDQFQLRDQLAFHLRLWRTVLRMMLRGTLIDQLRRQELARELQEAYKELSAYFERVLGHPLNPRSPKQMHALFYEDFKQAPIYNPKSKPDAFGNRKPTLNDEALQTIGKREPLLRPLVNAIGNWRSVGTFISTFIESRMGDDGRMRCSFNIDGTTTLRFSSSEDAFGDGMNLENIPSDKSKAIAKAKKRGGFELPNVRSMFIPDSGFTMFDADLDRADLQVVVWEAEDEGLKQMLREGVDLHRENAKVLFGLQSVGNVTPAQREFVKTFIHGTNYGGSSRTMAINSNCTVAESERFQARWFGEHPSLKKWHDRIKAQIYSTRTVSNKFGYRRQFFERIESILPEALAWIPQSTVACAINRGLVAIDENLPDVQMLLQVHDSVVGQFPSSRPELLESIRQLLQIVIPYSDPLIIPVGIKISEKSWGDCH